MSKSIRERIKSERVQHQIFSALGWGSLGVLGVLFALIAQGTLVVEARHAAFFYFGLGGVILFSVSQLVLCHLRAEGPVRASSGEPIPEGRLSTRPLDYLVSLLNVSRAVSNEVSILDLGQVIVDSCRDCFECDEVSLMMLEPGGTELSVAAFTGHRDSSKIRNARVKIGEGVAGKVAETRIPIILGPEIEKGRFPGFQAKARRINSSMVAPIIVRNRVIGVLSASTGSSETSYSEDDLRVLCILAEHAGIAAAKARDNDRVVRLVRKLRKRHQSQLAQAGMMPTRDDKRNVA